MTGREICGAYFPAPTPIPHPTSQPASPIPTFGDIFAPTRTCGELSKGNKISWYMSNFLFNSIHFTWHNLPAQRHNRHFTLSKVLASTNTPYSNPTSFNLRLSVDDLEDPTLWVAKLLDLAIINYEFEISLPIYHTQCKNIIQCTFTIGNPHCPKQFKKNCIHTASGLSNYTKKLFLWFKAYHAYH